MRNLLITGGAGFIGANFVHYWLQHHPQDRVVVLDALTYAGNKANLVGITQNKYFRFVHGNISNLNLVEQILQEEKIDTIVNFAAESHVDRSITDPDAFIETNIIGTYQLLKAARKIWSMQPNANYRFHHVSTDEVYGTLAPTDPAFSETNAYAPNSPYAASKASSDHLVRAYYHTYGLPVTTSNCSNNYGPYHYPEKLIPLIITNALCGKSLPIYGDGKQVRDWLYVEDHCRGIELILEKGVLGEVYNIGGNNEKMNIEVTTAICNLLDTEIAHNLEWKNNFPASPAAQNLPTSSLIQFVNDRAGHDRRYAINARKITQELGYQPQVDFITGLKKTVRWYLENASWWQNILEKKENFNKAALSF